MLVRLYRFSSVLLVAAMLLVCAGCGDDDSFYPADPVVYDVVASEPRFVVPSAALPAPIEPLASNANVDILFHRGRLYFAWRSAPSHFASPLTRLYVMSSDDAGQTWDYEHTIELGTDMREPRLLSLDGKLQLLFFEAGSNPAAFEPKRIWRTRRLGAAHWSPLEVLIDAPEVPWDLKVRDGSAFLTSYTGGHYDTGSESNLQVHLKRSDDGDTFSLVDDRESVYRGGVSETAFEFDRDGSLWIVTRNEDGDASGFGSHVCRAAADALADWDCPLQSDPERYDSPEMFRHQDDIYLVARRDIGGPFDQADPSLPFEDRKFANLIAYSNRPKRTALYQIDKTERRVRHLFDLPSAGDTSFASVQQTGPHTFLVANYTSPLDDPDISWLAGQTSDRGTQLYLLTLTFVPRGSVVLPTATVTATAKPQPTPTPMPLDASVNLSPVFAAPGVPLSIGWPTLPDLQGFVDLGDSVRVGLETTEHSYPVEDAIYPIMATLTAAGAQADTSGFVARTSLRAQAPLRRFRLIDPADPVVQGVIRGVIPAFYWAMVGDTMALATDVTGRAAFAFDEVAISDLEVDGTGAFVSAALDLDVELATPGSVAAERFVGLRQARFRGRIEAGRIVSPIAMEAGIVLADVVDVLRVLGGFDEAGALNFLGGLFQFDPANPPETAPFVGEFAVETSP